MALYIKKYTTMTETLQEEAPSDDPTAVSPLNRSLSKRRDKQYGLYKLNPSGEIVSAAASYNKGNNKAR